jgi:PTH1 family peptidyl-tRNA hydrolase
MNLRTRLVAFIQRIFSDRPMEPDSLEHTCTYLIAGLGNPGREYINNRHNVGFMFVNRLADHLGITFNRMESNALVCKLVYQGCKLILAKPQTFMNLSGQPVAALLRYYKVPLEHMMVAYDDIDLPFGSLRLRPEGGSAGHNGMKSIIKRVGTNDFARLRIGINRPPGKMEAADYVLRNFRSTELEQLPTILDRAVEATLCFVTDSIEAAMNRYNTSDVFPELVDKE